MTKTTVKTTCYLDLPVSLIEQIDEKKWNERHPSRNHIIRPVIHDLAEAGPSLQQALELASPAPSPRKTVTIVIDGDDWEGVADVAHTHRTSRTSLIIRALMALVADEGDTDG